jgi:hypothetical protein
MYTWLIKEKMWNKIFKLDIKVVVFYQGNKTIIFRAMFSTKTKFIFISIGQKIYLH